MQSIGPRLLRRLAWAFIGGLFLLWIPSAFFFSLIVRALQIDRAVVSRVETWSGWLWVAGLVLGFAGVLYADRVERRAAAAAKLQADIDQMRGVVRALEHRVATGLGAQSISVDEYLLSDARRKLAEQESRLARGQVEEGQPTDWVKVALVAAVIGLGVGLFKLAEYASPYSNLAFRPSFTGSCDPDGYSCYMETYPSGDKCPSYFPIKGYLSATNRWLYVMPDEAAYRQITPDTCFATEYEAQSEGYHPRR
jgi:hypothetical protein